MDSGQVRFCRDVCGSRWNKTHTVQKMRLCQAISIKYMVRPPHGHWDLRILQKVLALIRSGNQTLEAHIFEAASTRDNISKGGDGTNEEPMEYRGPNVTVTVK